MVTSKAIVSSATPLNSEVVAAVADMLHVSDEHKALLKGITAENLSHGVTAAMAALRDTDSAQQAIVAAKALLSDAKRAVDAHTDYRVSIVAAIRAAAPKMGPTAVAELMYGKTGTSAAKTQIGRDYAQLDLIAAAGQFNIAAKAKGQQGVALTRAQAAKALRDTNAAQRKAIVSSMRETGTLPADEAKPVALTTKASTVVQRLSSTADALDTLDVATLDATTLAKIREVLAKVDAKVGRLAVAPAQATKTA